MDFSTLKYLNTLLSQEIALATSICESFQFLNTDTGLIVMTVQVKAMVGRVKTIDEMAKCRVKSTCYPQAPEDEVDAVFEKLRALTALCSQCSDKLAERQEAIRARERKLMEAMG